MRYKKAIKNKTFIGLNGKPCKNPKYWCKLHEVYLSPEDVEKKKCLHKPTFDMIGEVKCGSLEYAEVKCRMDFYVELIKEKLNGKKSLTESEKKYILNKITNAIRKTRTYNINNVQVATKNHENVTGRYKETIVLSSRKKVTIGFDYD